MRDSAPMLDVLCVGEALVDLLGTRRGPLRASESFRRFAGGAPANVARALARLGARAGWMWSVGDDELGGFLLDALAADGIDVSRAVRKRACTELAFIALDEQGNPHFSGYGFPGASQRFEAADVDVGYVGATTVVHFGANTLLNEPVRRATLAAMAAARDAERTISLDPNFRLHLWPSPAHAVASVRALLPGIDVLKVSAEEATLLTGVSDAAESARILRGWHVGLVVVTLGAGGCVYANERGEGGAPTTPV